MTDQAYALREFVSDVVYHDLITKVCFLGAPSTGKSTLVKALAEHYQTECMPEYGAEYWRENQVDRRITLAQFEEIAPEHLRREDAKIRQANQYLFADTCPITTYVFAKDYHGQAGPILTRLARAAEKRYDLFFLCDTDIPYADTWDRSGDQKRHWFQQQIIGDLAERRIPYFTLRGDLGARVQQVHRILEQYQPYRNVLGISYH